MAVDRRDHQRDMHVRGRRLAGAVGPVAGAAHDLVELVRQRTDARDLVVVEVLPVQRHALGLESARRLRIERRGAALGEPGTVELADALHIALRARVDREVEFLGGHAVVARTLAAAAGSGLAGARGQEPRLLEVAKVEVQGDAVGKEFAIDRNYVVALGVFAKFR